MTFFKKMTSKKHIRTTFIVSFFVFGAILWLSMWVYGKFYVSTDDAYVNANIVHIAPRISGQVVRLYVINNQFVRKNQPLFDIDPLPLQVALDKAKAQVDINEAALLNAQSKEKRTLTLEKKKFASTQEGENAETTLQTAEASLKLSNAELNQAMLNLSWGSLAAPTSGWITNLSLHTGDIVTANQPLFGLISNQIFWIDANFKETQIQGIKPGQRALIHVDMYPDHLFHGVVQSISGATGSVFSLLPPQNATGNWVKITQRVPVRILVTDPNPNYLLRIGTSASVTIKLD